MASDALLLGRVTYQDFADASPSGTGDFADKFNTMPKYVVSTTIEDPEWNNSTVIKGDVAEETSSVTLLLHASVSKLKQQSGRE